MSGLTWDQWMSRETNVAQSKTIESILLLRQEHGWGYRKIAKALDLGDSLVRRVLEADDRKTFPQPEPLKAAVWDLETTGLKSDIGTLLMGSFLDLNTGVTTTERIAAGAGSVFERERDVIERIATRYMDYTILIGHNSKTFDRNFLGGVMARHGMPMLPRRYHIDTMQVARYGLKGLLQSISLENVADFFGVGVKNKPSKHDWRGANLLDEGSLEQIRIRCESDVELNAAVWTKLIPYWVEWKGDR